MNLTVCLFQSFSIDKVSIHILIVFFPIIFSVQQEIVSAARIEWIYIDAITAEYSPSNVKNSTKLEFTLGRIYDLVSTVLDSSSSNNTVVHRVFIPCLYEILTVSEILPHEMVRTRLKNYYSVVVVVMIVVCVFSSDVGRGASGGF